MISGNHESWRFRLDGPLNTTEAAAVLRRRVVPSRTAILQILDRLSELQVLSQRRHEAEVSALYAELRNRLLVIGALAILVGLIVAVLATIMWVASSVRLSASGRASSARAVIWSDCLLGS